MNWNYLDSVFFNEKKNQMNSQTSNNQLWKKDLDFIETINKLLFKYSIQKNICLNKSEKKIESEKISPKHILNQVFWICGNACEKKNYREYCLQEK